MKYPTLIDGIKIAIAISLGAAAVSLLLGGLIVYALMFELLLYGAALAYLLYLLKRSEARLGRMLVITGWAAITLGCWALEVAALEQVLIQAGFIWLVRSLYFHHSLAGAALDFGLVSVGLAAAAWAMLNTGSLVAAIWSFLLVQALFCGLPRLSGRHRGVPQDPCRNRFQAAHRVAVDAARKLSQP